MTPALANDQLGIHDQGHQKALPAVLHPNALMGRIICSRHVEDNIYQGCRLGNLPVNTSALLVLRRNTTERYKSGSFSNKKGLTVGHR